MTTCLNIPVALPLAATFLALVGCGTQEIDPNNVIAATQQAGPDVGGLIVVCPSSKDSYQAEQAAPPPGDRAVYDVLLDGRIIVEDYGTGELKPFIVGEDGDSAVAYLPAGAHHFTITVPGSAPIFDGDGEIPGGASTYLFLYGPLDAVQGRFVTMPSTVAAGTEHDVVVNLMRSGQTIEVVSCTDPTTCAAVSPPLALGDAFEADLPFPADGTTNESIAPTGDGIGYRLVPSATSPAPFVITLTGALLPGVPMNPRPAVFVGAPVFMSAQGDPQVIF